MEDGLRFLPPPQQPINRNTLNKPGTAPLAPKPISPSPENKEAIRTNEPPQPKPVTKSLLTNASDQSNQFDTMYAAVLASNTPKTYRVSQNQSTIRISSSNSLTVRVGNSLISLKPGESKTIQIGNGRITISFGSSKSSPTKPTPTTPQTPSTNPAPVTPQTPPVDAAPPTTTSPVSTEGVKGTAGTGATCPNTPPATFQQADAANRSKLIDAIKGSSSIMQKFQNWSSLSLQERMKTADSILSLEANIYGFSDPALNYKADLPSNCGGYWDGKQVVLGPSALKDPQRMVSVLTHEGAHAFQSSVVDKLKTGQLSQGDPAYPTAVTWKNNMANYRSVPPSSYQSYSTQPIEVHSFATGNAIASGVFSSALA